MEAALGFEPRMKDLQSSALPLGDAAIFNFYKDGAENGIRTRDPRLGKAMLYHWAISAKNLVPRPRIELGTRGFSVHCSTDWAISAFKIALHNHVIEKDGGVDEIWTRDLLRDRQAC